MHGWWNASSVTSLIGRQPTCTATHCTARCVNHCCEQFSRSFLGDLINVGLSYDQTNPCGQLLWLQIWKWAVNWTACSNMRSNTLHQRIVLREILTADNCLTSLWLREQCKWIRIAWWIFKNLQYGVICSSVGSSCSNMRPMPQSCQCRS